MAKTKTPTGKSLAPGSFADNPNGLEELLANMKPGSTLESLEEVGLSSTRAKAAEAELVRQMAIAEKEEERVQIRWAPDPLHTIQRAAAMAGVPYQTYIKMVAFRQAVADIQSAEAIAAAKTFALPPVGGRKAAQIKQD